MATCETCGQEFDPEIRKLRGLLNQLGDDWHEPVAAEIHAVMDTMGIRKGRRQHYELAMQRFFYGLQRRAGISDSASLAQEKK